LTIVVGASDPASRPVCCRSYACKRCGISPFWHLYDR